MSGKISLSLSLSLSLFYVITLFPDDVYKQGEDKVEYENRWWQDRLPSEKNTHKIGESV